MAPFVRLLGTALAFHEGLRSPSSTTLQASLVEEAQQATDFDLSRLCSLFGAAPVDLLSLKANEKGIRGVYLNKPVKEGEAILKIPLESCLRDDTPPAWLQASAANDGKDAYAVSLEGWVTRLTACLIDAKLQQEKSEAMEMWLNLLPTDLRQLLPIHWDSSVFENSNDVCRPLELAVDSAYFARAAPLGDLIISANEANLGLKQSQIEDALDLVQTRSCRAVSSSDGTPYMRVLVPIFDLINHNRDHNAEFFREGDYMVIRCRREIDAGDEVFISYGGSTQPAWKCLFSYGFVPLSEDFYEDDIAEIIVDGMRFEIGPTEIPFELVQHEAEKLGLCKEGEEVEFTPEIGQNIVDRLVENAKTLDENGSNLKDETVANKMVADLKKFSRRTLLACAGGLREYLEEQ